MATVAEIWRYPVKSMAGERLASSEVTDQGLVGDRRWALVDGTVNRAGKLLTMRQDEKLLTYRPQLFDDRVEVVTPEGGSRLLDDELVRHLAAQTERPLVLRDVAGGNFDDSPVLVVNMATVAAFGIVAGSLVDHRRFRANLYVDGLENEEELGWMGRRLRFGEVELEVIKRCERCVAITLDPDTTVATPELLRLLAQTQETCLGVYCGVVRPGRVAEGDACGPV